MSKQAAATTDASPMRVTARPKISERVAAELRREIVTGELSPGDRLQNERELQERYGISRPTLREALRMLESETLISVERGQHGGPRVTMQDPRVLARHVGACLQMQGATLCDVWEARSLIEPGAARMLAERGSEEAIKEMLANIAHAREALDDPVAYGRLTNDFSLILTRHCGNLTLNVLATLIQDIVERQHVDVTVRTRAEPGVERMRELNVRSREKLMGLVKEGKAVEAESFWRKHLIESGKVVFSAYQRGQPIDMV